MTEDHIERLAQRTADVLLSRSPWGSPEAHADDHRWIKERREAQQVWRRMRAKVLASAAIWAVPIILAFVAVASWEKIVRALTSAAGS